MILSAPMLGILTGAQPYALARMAAATMTLLGQGSGYILGGPYDPFVGTMESDGLTHDQARHDRTRAQILANRDLALGNVTWGWVDSAMRAVEWIARDPSVTRISIPVTVVAAGQDRLVDNGAEAAVVARLPRGRYVEIPGARHEILMETDELRAPFWREFDTLVASISRPA
jgi:lysophospholipase